MTPPAISGTGPLQVGDVPTETPAVWAGSPTVIRGPMVDCEPDNVTIQSMPIAGATGTTYTVAASVGGCGASVYSRTTSSLTTVLCSQRRAAACAGARTLTVEQAIRPLAERLESVTGCAAFGGS